MQQLLTPSQDFDVIFDGLEGPQWQNSEQAYQDESARLKQLVLEPPGTEHLLSVLASWDRLQQRAQTQFVYLNMLEYRQYSGAMSQRKTQLMESYQAIQVPYHNYLKACEHLFEESELDRFASYYKNLRYDNLLAPFQQQYAAYRKSYEQFARGEMSGQEQAQDCALILKQNAEIMKQSALTQDLQDSVSLSAELDELPRGLLPDLLELAQTYQFQLTSAHSNSAQLKHWEDAFDVSHAQYFTQQAVQRLSPEIETMTRDIFEDRFWFFAPQAQLESRDWSNFTSRGSVGLMRFQPNIAGVLRTAHEMGHCVLYDMLLKSAPFVCMPQSKLLHEFVAILFEFLVFFEIQSQEKSRVLAEQRERQFWRKWIQQIYFNLDIIHFELQLAESSVQPDAESLSRLWSELRQASGVKSAEEWRHIPHLYGSGGRLLYCHHYALCPLLVLACLVRFSGQLGAMRSGVLSFMQQAAVYPLDELFEKTLGLELNHATLNKAFQALLHYT